MTSILKGSFKISLTAAALILSVFLAQGILAGAAAAKPGDPGYNYPVLKEKDFAMFLDLVDLYAADGSVEDFLDEHGITHEYLMAVYVKISKNITAKLNASSDEIAGQYGKSIIFNSSEDQLYAKYEDRIIMGLLQAEQARE